MSRETPAKTDSWVMHSPLAGLCERRDSHRSSECELSKGQPMSTVETKRVFRLINEELRQIQSRKRKAEIGRIEGELLADLTRLVGPMDAASAIKSIRHAIVRIAARHIEELE